MGGLKLNAKNRIVINKGDKFGRLTFIEEIRIGNRRIGRCICECGKIVESRLFNLKNGNTNSCGCFGKENLLKANTTHGLSKHRLFPIYNGIIDRCTNSSSKNYSYYGGKGINCEWETFQDFLNDMELSYVEGLTVDRIDGNGNYCKANCRWATSKEQSRNRKSNLIYKGKCVLDWCNELGLNNRTIYHRINLLGWSIEDALNTPIREKKKGNVEIISRNNFIDRVEVMDGIEVHTYYNPEYENYSIIK